MGQYYKAICIENLECVKPHDFGNGAKLMEHSYIGNNFVSVVESLLTENGKWNNKRIVWGGDYADNEENKDTNLYGLSVDVIKPKTILEKGYNYVINLDKKEFFDKTKLKDYDGWVAHPLPILTCEGNGRGGGDYREEKDFVGSWARNRILISKEKPSEDFKELILDIAC